MKNKESDGKLSHPILFYLNKFLCTLEFTTK